MVTLLTTQERTAVPDAAWVYLGEDFSTLRDLERVWGAERRISIAMHLEAALYELRQEFVDWISREGEKSRFSLAWWMTNGAGHNTALSKLFLDLCHLRVLERLTEQEDPADLLVVCHDDALADAAAVNLRRRGVAVVRRPGWWTWRLRSRAIGAVCWMARWVKGPLGMMGTLRAAARSRGPKDVAVGEWRETILILTCVDQAALGQDGVFRDRYFPGLADELRRRGENVQTIPWLYNFGPAQQAGYRWFRAQPDRFLLLEDYMRWWDLIPAALVVLGAAWVHRDASDFRGWDLRALLWRERLQDSSAHGRLRYLLYRPALRRWLRAGGRCRSFVQAMENMSDERPALEVLHRLSPDTITCGYQHIGGLPSDALGYLITVAEWKSGGLPKRVIANSRTTAAQLRSGGIDPAAVCEGPALRYRYLTESDFADVPARPRRLLALLPLEVHSAVELLTLLMEFRAPMSDAGWEVALKPHPMCDRAALQSALGVSEWPADWRWLDGPVQQHLNNTGVAIGYGSSLLDAAASGVPFLSVRRELGFTSNPLDAWAEEFECCRNVPRSSFLAKLNELASHPPAAAVMRASLAKRIRNDLGPCTGSWSAVFSGRPPSHA